MVLVAPSATWSSEFVCSALREACAHEDGFVWCLSGTSLEALRRALCEEQALALLVGGTRLRVEWAYAGATWVVAVGLAAAVVLARRESPVVNSATVSNR